MESLRSLHTNVLKYRGLTVYIIYSQIFNVEDAWESHVK